MSGFGCCYTKPRTALDPPAQRSEAFLPATEQPLQSAAPEGTAYPAGWGLRRSISGAENPLSYSPELFSWEPDAQPVGARESSP